MTVLKHCASLVLAGFDAKHRSMIGRKKNTGRRGKTVSQFEACNDPSLRLLCICEGVSEGKVKNLILILLPAKKKSADFIDVFDNCLTVSASSRVSTSLACASSRFPSSVIAQPQILSTSYDLADFPRL